jgi:HK97 family phage prohead protease
MFTDYPKAASENAKRAIRIKEENDRGCGTRVGWTRARQLADRKPISLDTVRRMASFNRHRQNSQGDPKESCGPLMWLAWGGDEGIDWAIRTSDANKMMKFKSNPQEIKDLDSKEGVVVAYANVYDFEDSDGDISAKGSFKRTVNNNFKRIRVLKDHNSTISLGIPLEMDADDPYGLKTTTQFNLKKEVARDMFTDLELMLENGMSPELSIGYEVVKRDEEDRKLIKEYKLYEYSFLTGWGANMLSVAEGVKDLKSTYGIMELIEKSYDLDYSDSRLRQIEELLKSITEEPVLDTDSADATPDDSLKDLFDNFNLTTIQWNLKNK